MSDHHSRATLHTCDEDTQADRSAGTQARRLAALLRLSSELSGDLSEAELGERVVAGLHSMLGYDHVLLLLVDEDTGHRSPAAAAGLVERPFTIAPGTGLSELPLLDSQLHYTADVTKCSAYIGSLSGSEVDVPVIIEGQVRGVLVVESRETEAFDQQDFEVLTSAAQQAGIAIEKARLLAAARRRADEMEALRSTASDIAAELELPLLLRSIVERASSLLDATGGELGLVDLDRGIVRIVVSYNLGRDYVGTIHRMGEGLMGRVAETAQPLIIDDYHAWSGALPHYSHIHATLGVPLVIGENVLGVFTAVSTDPLRRFSRADLHLLTLFAHQAAIALENARLFEDTNTRLAQLTALQETIGAVASTLDLDTLLSMIVEQAASLLRADAGLIYMVDWPTRTQVEVASIGTAAVSDVPADPLSGSLSGWVAIHNTPTLSDNVHEDERVDHDALTIVERRVKGEIESVAVVPLAIKDEVVGTLVVMGKQGGRGSFIQADLDLLMAFASQAATAIENARLFAAEQRRVEQFRLISEVGRQMVSILDVDELLNEIVTLVKEILGFYLVGVSLVEGDEIVVRTGAGPYFDVEREPLRLKLDEHSIAGRVATTGEPHLSSDVSRDPHFFHVPEIPDTMSELAVPLRTKEKIIGVLDLQSRHLNAFDQTDLIVLQSLADQAAIAIDNSLLYRQARQLAALEERQRLARDLHDSVTQAVYGITLYSRAARDQLALGQLSIVADHLEQMQETSQEALAEMRLLIHELRPQTLDQGLVGALQDRLLAVESRAGLKVSLEAEDYVGLSPDAEQGVYLIVQEALNNALKHASAASVTVRLNRGEHSVTVDVLDDGRGFDTVAAQSGGGLGLSTMTDRALSIGAQLKIDSEPGKGTHVSVEVPM